MAGLLTDIVKDHCQTDSRKRPLLGTNCIVLPEGENGNEENEGKEGNARKEGGEGGEGG